MPGWRGLGERFDVNRDRDGHYVRTINDHGVATDFTTNRTKPLALIR